MLRWTLIAIGLQVLAHASSSEAQPALISSGRFAPLFGLDQGQTDLPVGAFLIDRKLVTNAQFEQFVRAHPRWAPEKVPGLLADSQYLAHWRREGAPGAQVPAGWAGAPVTRVSWFAARAYCRAQGGRLPSVLEWEYVAAADETRKDASRERDFVERILRWYARPFSERELLRSKGAPANVWGVSQLHELVWEWTEDFNGVFVTGDNRQDGDKSNSLYCGNSATGSANREDYAAFMRYALRNSVEARYTLANLGFRCAYDVAVSPDGGSR